MPQLSDFLGRNDTINLQTGEAVSLSDVGEIGPDGLLYAAMTTDYAVKPNIEDVAVAQASVLASFIDAYHRQPIIQGDDGSLYFAVPNAVTPTGMQIKRYNAAGALVNSQTIDSTANQVNGIVAFLLSNGDIALVWETTGTVMLKFAVVDQLLNIVKAATNIEAPRNGSNVFDATALSGGGFSIVWQQDASPELQRLATYSNTGTVVLPPTTIITWNLGTAGDIYTKVGQCVTSGNLFVVCASQFTGGSTNTGLNYIVVNPTTASVVHALGNLSSVANINQAAEISVFAGFVGVSWPDGTNHRMWVFNEAGTQQGSTYAPATSSSNARRSRLINDGTKFYLFWDASSSTKKRLTKILTTGGASASVIDISTDTYNKNCDAFYERGYLLFIAQAASGAAQPYFGTVTTSNFSLVTAPTQFGSAPATTNGLYPSCLAVGDFAFAFCSDQANVAATVFTVVKYADTCLAGVIAADATVNTFTPVNVVEGAYQSNLLKGTVSKSFDMTTASIPGNKGVLFPNGVILKGF